MQHIVRITEEAKMALRICIFNIFLKLGQVILLWKHFFFLFSCKYLTGTLRKKKIQFFPKHNLQVKGSNKGVESKGSLLWVLWQPVQTLVCCRLGYETSPAFLSFSPGPGSFCHGRTLTLPVLSGCFCCCGCCPGNSSREEENNFGFFSVQFQWWNHFLTRRFIWEGDVLGMLESFLVAG